MIHLVHHDGNELREEDFQGLDRLPEDGWFWLDVETSDFDEIHAIGTALGFDPLSIEDVVTEMLPKIDVFGDYRYVVWHGLAHEDDRITTVEFDVFVGARMLVTFHAGPVHGLDHTRAAIQTSSHEWIGSPAQLAAHILDVESRRFPNLIDALDDQIDQLEDRAMLADNTVLGSAQALRRDVIVLRRVFGPQRDVLQALARDETLDLDSRREFGNVFDHHFRFVESLDSARALIGSVQETLRGAIGARTNEVMKVLTVFSAILLPLTLIAGIWGMNLDLPFAETPQAFRLVAAAMAVIAVGLWVYFVWRGFVGGPRLRKIPRAVGFTISHLTATTRPPRRRRDDVSTD